MKQKLIIFLVAFLCSCEAWALSDISVGDIIYRIGTLSHPFAKVVEYKPNTTGEYIIPESIVYNNVTFSVTSIDTWYGCQYLKSLTIPKTVDLIEGFSFYYARNLETLIIADSEEPLDCGHIQGINDVYAPQFSYTKIKKLYIGRPLKYTPYSEQYRNYRPFNGINTLEEVEVGATVNDISFFESLEFHNNFKRLVLNCQEPPLTYQQSGHPIFSNKQLLNIEVIVPVGTLERYKSEAPWCDVLNIKESQDNAIKITLSYDEKCGSVFLNKQLSNSGTSIHQKGCDVELTFIPAADHELKSVILNEVDVTQQLLNNTLYLKDVHEDLDIKVEYRLPKLKLQISGFNGGCISIPIEKGMTIPIEITPESGWKINTLFINNRNATSEIYQNTVVVKDIASDIMISVVFEKSEPSAISQNRATPKITIDSNTIIINNTDESVIVYDTNGRLLHKSMGATEISLLSNCIYIVKIGDSVYKVAL